VRDRRPPTRIARLALERFEDQVVPAQITVTSLNASGFGTLADAIAALGASPQPGDSIVFDQALFVSGPATITLGPTAGLPTITDSMTITGPDLVGGVPQLTIHRPGTASPYRIFDIAGSSPLQVTLQNLTVSGGYDLPASGDGRGGAIRFAATQGGNTLTIQNCDLTNNTAQGATATNTTPAGDAYGGALYAASVAVTVTGSSIQGNSAGGGVNANSKPVGTGYGGGLAVVGGSAVVTGGSVANNQAGGATGSGGGLYASNVSFQATGTADATRSSQRLRLRFVGAWSASTEGNGAFAATQSFAADGRLVAAHRQR
jgi:hypothetical protein